MPTAVPPADSESAAKARLLRNAAREVVLLEDSMRRTSRNPAFHDNAAFFTLALLAAFILGYCAALFISPAFLVHDAQALFHENHKQ